MQFNFLNYICNSSVDSVKEFTNNKNTPLRLSINKVPINLFVTLNNSQQTFVIFRSIYFIIFTKDFIMQSYILCLAKQ